MSSLNYEMISVAQAANIIRPSFPEQPFSTRPFRQFHNLLRNQKSYPQRNYPRKNMNLPRNTNFPTRKLPTKHKHHNTTHSHGSTMHVISSLNHEVISVAQAANIIRPSFSEQPFSNCKVRQFHKLLRNHGLRIARSDPSRRVSTSMFPLQAGIQNTIYLDRT